MVTTTEPGIFFTSGAPSLPSGIQPIMRDPTSQRQGPSHLHLDLPALTLQSEATGGRVRATSNASSSAWSPRNGPTAEWKDHAPPSPLPSPGIYTSGSRTNMFFGQSHTSGIPTPPRPLGEPTTTDTPSVSPTTAKRLEALEPLSANPTGPLGGEFLSTRNRQRSRGQSPDDRLEGLDVRGDNRLPSEVAADRAKSIQSLNRARSLNDKPPTRSNTFFATSYAVTPPPATASGSVPVPVQAVGNRPRTVSSVDAAKVLPGIVSLGMGSPSMRHLGPAHRSTTMPTSVSHNGLCRPGVAAASGRQDGTALPISPVESVTPKGGSGSLSYVQSPPSKLRREASNAGGLQDAVELKAGDLLHAGAGEDGNGGAEASGSTATRSYRLEKELGEGAFSVVWSAREVDETQEAGTGTIVAIKLMDKRLCERNDRTRISFVREVAVLKHISHPQIVSFISSFSTPSYHCLVLEHLGGGELFDRVKSVGHRKSMGEELLRRVFTELCRGVAWLHEVAAVVHRDLKLENVLLTVDPFDAKYQTDGMVDVDKLPKPLVKLSDFGLSRFIDVKNPMLRTRCGSELYSSPEVVLAQPYDGRDTDAWACGVILYALATGTMPFDVQGGSSSSHEDQLRKSYMRIARASFKWPEGSTASLGVREVVGRLLVRNPQQRMRVADLWELEWMAGRGALARGSWDEGQASTGVDRHLAEMELF